MAYSFYLDKVLLPVTPESVSTKIKGNNKTFTLMNGEEINIPKSPGLTEISFEALLPNTEYPFAVYPDGFSNAKKYLNKLEELKKKACFPFQIIRELPSGDSLFDTTENMNVTLEEYEIKEDANQGCDMMVSIKLKQYRHYSTALKATEITKNDKGDLFAAPAAERPTDKEIPKSYTVVKGDTLWSICKKQLGDGARCWEIARQNAIPDPNKIYPGQVVRFG